MLVANEERGYIIFIYGQTMFPLAYQQIFDDVMKKMLLLLLFAALMSICCIDVYVTLFGG